MGVEGGGCGGHFWLLVGVYEGGGFWREVTGCLLIGERGGQVAEKAGRWSEGPYILS